MYENKAQQTIPSQPVKEKEPEKPLLEDFFSLGEGKGIRVVLWKNSILLERREKNQETGKWEVKQEINLAPQIIEHLYIRLPLWYKLMKEK